MEFVWNNYVLIGVLNATLALLVLAGCWRSRHLPAARPLIAMLISISLWALLGSLEMAAVGVKAKVFWNTWLYIPVLAAPISYLLFAISYTGKARWLTPLFYGVLLFPAFLTFGAAVTNHWHQQLWTSFTLAENNILIYGHGPIFWVGLVAYTYVLFGVASFLLLRAAILFPKPYRAQAILVAISSLIPFVGSFLFVMGVSPIPGIDPTPLYLAGSGALMGLGVLRMKLLDLLPVARATLFENMSDGMVVFDHRKRVLDYNVAAHALMGESLYMGAWTSNFSPIWAELLSALDTNQRTHVEILVSSRLVLEASVTPLPVPGHSGVAHIVVLRDITRMKHVENALRDANTQLQELAVRDALTGLYNRRFLMEALPKELARCRREAKSLAVAMMDIDHFKQFNDDFGHQAGDAMLVELGHFLKSRIRQEDLACRYGGEEFVLILTGADESGALQKAESIRVAFAEHQVHWKNQWLQATLSIGVACYPDQAEDDTRLLHCADQALYAAKAGGRNQCVGASSIELRATGQFESLKP